MPGILVTLPTLTQHPKPTDWPLTGWASQRNGRGVGKVCLVPLGPGWGQAGGKAGRSEVKQNPHKTISPIINYSVAEDRLP